MMENNQDMVPMISSKGKRGMVPRANVEMALQKGFQIAGDTQNQMQQQGQTEQQIPQEQMQQSPQQQSSVMDVLKGKLGEWGENVGNAIIGGSNAVTRQMVDALNLVNKLNPNSLGDIEAPQLNPLSGTKEDLMYQLGEGGGNIAGFMVGGGGLNAARKAMEYGPGLIGQAAKGLGGEGLSAIGRRGIGAGLYGAAENPENMASGAIGGALMSAAPEAGAGVIKKGFEKLSATKAAQELGSQIHTIFKDTKKQISELYQPIVDKFGESKIYDMAQRLEISGKKRIHANMIEEIPKNTAYGAMDKKYSNKFGGKIEDMNDEFIKSPTFDKAHKLQSQLGYEIRDLQKQAGSGKLDTIGKDRLHAYEVARNNLKEDMQGFLGKKSPELAQQYEQGAEEYLTKIVPFLKDKNIAQLATGYSKKPKNVNKLIEGLEGDDYLASQFADQLRSLKYKQMTPNIASKTIAPIGHILGINQMVAPAFDMAKNTSPKIYDALRNTLLSNILANRGNQ